MAEKALFLTLAGKLTRKTLARVYILVVGGRRPGRGTPGFLLYPWRDFPTLGRSPVGRFSRADLRASQGRVRRLSLVDQPTCAPLGALSLIGRSNYNHLLFTVSLYRYGVLGFWGNGVWNLRLNKAKSQVLTDDNIPEIAGIPCANHLKYLGVPVHLDHKEQRDKCIASIKRNLGHLKWKLRKVDLDVKETLTCVLARSILVYTGTPMVAAGLWKREDIDRLEA